MNNFYFEGKKIQTNLEHFPWKSWNQSNGILILVFQRAIGYE